MLMYGSTMFFVQVLQSLAPHPKLWPLSASTRGPTRSPPGWPPQAALPPGFKTSSAASRSNASSKRRLLSGPGADGLIMLPYFAGERTPIFDPRARGVIAGLTLRHSRAHLFRAIYEGIAFGIRQILELLESDINPIQRLVAVGGGTQGGLWTQIVSDVTGRAQQLPAQAIGASYGDALMAAIGTGQVSANTDWTVTARTVTPTDTTRELYHGLYRIYCDLYPATKATTHYLAQLQEHEATDAGGSMP